MVARYTSRVHEVTGSDGSPDFGIAVHEWAPAKARGTVVYVHALSGCGHDFEYLAQYLAERGLRCIAPDFPGHGDTGAIAGQTNDSALATRCFFSIAQSVATGPVYYIGSSWGGHILLPALLTGLCQLDGLLLNDVVLEWHDSLAQLSSRVAEKGARVYASVDEIIAGMRAEASGHYRQVDMPDIEEAVLREWAHRRFARDASGHWRERFLVSVVEPLARFPGGGQSRLVANPLRQVTRLRCPVVMIYGSESPLCRTKSLAALLKVRPNVSELILKGGHAPKLMTDDQVSAVYQKLCDMGYAPDKG